MRGIFYVMQQNSVISAMHYTHKYIFDKKNDTSDFGIYIYISCFLFFWLCDISVHTHELTPALFLFCFEHNITKWRIHTPQTVDLNLQIFRTETSRTLNFFLQMQMI
jgi:hypothetical protein